MPNDPLIILLNGPPGSGKTTIQNILTNVLRMEHNFVASKASYADPIKRMAEALFCCDYTELNKDYPHAITLLSTPRELLIDIGTRLRKKFGEDIFVRSLRERIRVYTLSHEVKNVGIVVDDLGFQNEYNLINSLFGNTYVIQTKRSNCSFERDSRDYVNVMPHRLFHITNNHDLDYLTDQTIYFLRKIVEDYHGHTNTSE